MCGECLSKLNCKKDTKKSYNINIRGLLKQIRDAIVCWQQKL